MSCHLYHIDDSSSDRDLLSMALQEVDEDITYCGLESGASCLSLLNTVLTPFGPTRPDLFIVDVYMPIMNGIELAENIRLTTHYAYAPIIMLSGAANIINKTEALKTGALRYERKPQQFNQYLVLAAQISSWTRNPSRLAQASG